MYYPFPDWMLIWKLSSPGIRLVHNKEIYSQEAPDSSFSNAASDEKNIVSSSLWSKFHCWKYDCYITNKIIWEKQETDTEDFS